MKAVVLAAGEGVRLQPLTSTRPKHMIKIGGKPLLEHCLNAIKASGLNEILIVVGYMGKTIREYFGDGKNFGLKINYVEQKKILGTGNAVSVVEPHVTEDFLLVYGDLLFSAEVIRKVLNVYMKAEASAVMAVVPVATPENYGIVELDKDEKVKRIVEKPERDLAPTNLANAGIYVFKNEIFGKIRETTASIRGEWEITDAISLLLKAENNVLAAKISKEEWIDIGRPWDLLEANSWILRNMRHRLLGKVEDGAHIIGPVTVAENARVRSGAYIEGPAFIDDESDVGPNCYIRPCTSIGKEVRIGNACEVKNSIVMDNVHIGHLSYVGDSIIGENCNLGAGTITANYRLDGETVKMMVKGEIINSGRRKLGAILGDNIKTGINALFMPGVKVGANSWVGPNLIVTRDLPSNAVVLAKQDLEVKSI